MSNFKALIRDLKNTVDFFTAWAGNRLVDPIEIFYEPLEGNVFPIISKSGNSSVKLKLIRKYNENFNSKFPEIHEVDPYDVTKFQLKRLFFYSLRDYSSFCEGKNVVIVVRNPYKRFYSLFLSIKSSRNHLYRYPAGMERFFNFNASMSFDNFTRKIVRIPDAIADRHFRSQSFYLCEDIKLKAHSFEVVEMKSFLGNENDFNGQSESIHLNRSKQELPVGIYDRLRSNPDFLRRYKADFELYRISTTFPMPPLKN